MSSTGYVMTYFGCLDVRASKMQQQLKALSATEAAKYSIVMSMTLGIATTTMNSLKNKHTQETINAKMPAALTTIIKLVIKSLRTSNGPWYGDSYLFSFPLARRTLSPTL